MQPATHRALRDGASLCGRLGVSRRNNGLVACRHQRRWDLWIDDPWLPFQLRLPGVPRVRVPPSSGACRACGLPPGARMSQPGHAPSGAAGALWRTGRWGKQWGH